MQKDEEARRKREERVLWLEAERQRRYHHPFCLVFISFSLFFTLYSIFKYALRHHTENDKSKKRDDTPSDPKKTQQATTLRNHQEDKTQQQAALYNHKHTKGEEKPHQTTTTTTTLHTSKDEKLPQPSDHSTSQESAEKYDVNQKLENLLTTPGFVTDFTGYLTEAGFVDAIYCWNELQNYKTLQKGMQKKKRKKERGELASFTNVLLQDIFLATPEGYTTSISCRKRREWEWMG